MAITSLPFRRIYTSKIYQLEYRTKQPRPFLLAAPYSLKRATIISATGSEKTRDPSTDWNIEELPSISSIQAHTYNTAYARFVAKLGETSSFGATLTAERRETYGMIRDFVVKLYKSGRAARRGDFLGVLHELNFQPPMVRKKRVYVRKKGKKKFYRTYSDYYVMPDRRLVEKKAASSWLLWSYGVQPLLSDIQNATEIFIRAVPDGTRVFASATSPVKVHSLDMSGGTRQISKYDGSVKVGLNAYVVCENYDLWLLNQLGLVNPLQWINEAVPFSFVIDWASNWSQVINSLTDFVGLRFTRSSVSTKRMIVETYVTTPVVVTAENSYAVGAFNTDHFYFGRRVGIPSPTLKFAYERFKWQRALNAISLLVGFLPKSHKN